MDGPVITAAKISLEKGNVNLILPWVPKDAEEELKKAFDKTEKVRKLGKESSEIADYWFFETAVRLHRRGEGKPYKGLKPAGLDWGPVIPKADMAIETGTVKEVLDLLVETVKEEIQTKFDKVMAKKDYEANDVDAAREYVQAMLDFMLSSHYIYKFVSSAEKH
jgi:hypothetical protein